MILRPERMKRERVADYSLGMLHETLWILGAAAVAFAMAWVAIVVFR